MNTSNEERVLRSIRRGCSTATVFLDDTFTIFWASESIEVLLGYPLAEFVGRSAADLVHPDDIGDIVRVMSAELHAPTSFESAGPGRLVRATTRVRHADGSFRAVEYSIGNHIEDPEIVGYLMHLVDSQSQHATLTAYRSLVEEVDPIRVLQSIAESASVQFEGALVAIEADGMQVGFEHVAALEADSGTIIVKVDVDGESVGRVLVRSTVAYRDNVWPNHIVGGIAELVSHLVTRERSKYLLAKAALTDPLTGVGNRRAFDSALHSFGPKDGPFDADMLVAAFYVDLDGFKGVNDRYGHLIGDRILVETAHRIRNLVRADDVVARLGGDEFCVIVRVSDTDVAGALAERVRAAIEETIDSDGAPVGVGATIGVAVTTFPCDLANLVNTADRTLIEAKLAGKRTVRVVQV